MKTEFRSIMRGFSLKNTLSSFLILALTSACVPVAAVSTTVVGTTLAEERSAGDKVDDTVIKVKIMEKLAQSKRTHMFTNITAIVHEGRVLLTGSVPSIENKEEAVEITWKVHGVREVINEIEPENYTAGDYANDVMIASMIRSKVLVAENVRSINYKIEVNNGIVYILGVAQTQEEMDKVVNLASETKGAKKVVSHVVLKDDPRRSAIIDKKKEE